MGIIGLGKIGRAVAKLAMAFGMKVIAHTRRTQGRQEETIETVDLDHLFSQADVVSLHCPLTDETCGLVNKQRLQRMKPTALLINVSRGPLVVEEALYEALENGILAGAALDVLSQEPPGDNHVLFRAKNCIITPHIAWATRASRARLLETSIANLRSFVQGNYQNIVS